MTSLFDVSYALAWATLAAEAAMLVAIVEETAWLKRLDVQHRQFTKWPRLRGRVPSMKLRLLGGGELSLDSLVGESFILFFVAPAHATRASYNQLATSVHALWHRANERLFVICSGPEDECNTLADQIHTSTSIHMPPVAVDEDESVGRAFLVTSTPQAVEVDSDGRIERYGRPGT
jgi:hypothetical protein